jgi:hypothetical protein
MQILGIGRVAAEARVVGGDKPGQPCVRRGNRSSGLTRGCPRQPQLPRFREGRLLTMRSCNVPNARSMRPFACGLLAQMMSMSTARDRTGSPRRRRQPPCGSPGRCRACRCRTRPGCHAPSDRHGSSGSNQTAITSGHGSGCFVKTLLLIVKAVTQYLEPLHSLANAFAPCSKGTLGSALLRPQPARRQSSQPPVTSSAALFCNTGGEPSARMSGNRSSG